MEPTREKQAKKKRTPEERIAALILKAKGIQDEAKRIKDQQRVLANKQARKADTHLKVVLGAAILDLVRRGVLDSVAYGSLISQATLSDRDRASLAFPVLCPSAALSEPETSSRS